MIAKAPTAAAENVSGILDKVQAFIATARSAAAGGITWVEFGELLVALVRLLTSALDTVSAMSGSEKREMVLEAVALLFDAVADKAVPPAAWPIWFLVRPAVRSLVLALAAGTLEQVLPLVRLAR